MPTYEYRCKECGHEFEQVQAFTDPALTECPECHGPLRKVFGNVGIAFKGSGFYKNDSRSSSGKGDSSGSKDSGSSSSSSSDSGSSGSNDSKPSTDSKPSSEPKKAAAKDTKSSAKASTSA